MYIFGIDIPLVEILLWMGIASIILLIGVILLFFLALLNIRNSRRLENEISNLTNALMQIKKQETRKISSLNAVYEINKNKKDSFPKPCSRVKIKTPSVGQVPKNGIIKKVDRFLRRK